MKDNQQYTGLEIAIVGIGCRFPGASDWRTFWHNLENGVESVHFFSEEELLKLGMDEREIKQRDFVKAAAILKDKDAFDAAFFGYRPGEAQLMNPVHRIFHECVWEALEDAGYYPDGKEVIGIFAGAGEDINWKVYSMLKNAGQEIDDFTLGQLNNKDYLSALLSYKLNLKGPAFTVNTACSTSLVALNLACKSLLLGEVKIALAGGASINTQKNKGYLYQEGMINSADGHCRAFDEAASGCIGGEGAGVVVLKRLADAIKEGDHIYAIIRSSSVNNDGNQKVGFTAPGVEGQAECIKRALLMGRIKPESISYIEAHGTGTRLGDPIEIEALNIAFGRNHDHKCAIGSVKTNIGHLDTAAGIAGLIKTALSLYFKKIPASLHYKAPNADIDFAGGPFYVNAKLQEWDRAGDQVLRAGVSSFGIGGTNAHAILEEAPAAKEAGTEKTYKLLTLSAQTDQSLTRYINKLKTFLHQHENVNLADMAFTFQNCRKHFTIRKSIVYRNKQELLDLLQADKAGYRFTGIKEPGNKIVFMFPGQGTQYVNMCKDLYEHEPLFRETMDKGFSALGHLTGEDLKAVIFPNENPQENRINETRYTQPLLFLIGYSLARLMLSFGIKPNYLIGHSIGEYTAACIGGLFSFEDALGLVVKRSRLMNALPSGKMLSAAMSEQEAKTWLSADVSLAAVNGLQQVVFSGSEIAINELVVKLKQQYIPNAPLHTSHAFHSGMMEPVLEDFLAEVKKITFHPLQYSVVSNLTGQMMRQEQVSDPLYWVRHLRETVQFSAGIESLMSLDKELIYIEAGAGHTMSGLLKQCGGDTKPLSFNMVRSAKERMNDMQYITGFLGMLWEHGVNIEWTNYYKGERRQRIPLPAYSFEPTRYTAEGDPFESNLLTGNHSLQSTKGESLKDWLYYPCWKSTVRLSPERPEARVYLLFSLGNEVAGSIRRELEKNNGRVIEVLPGTSFENNKPGQYYLHPGEKAHFRKLVSELKTDGTEITDIIYMWAAETAAGTADGANKKIDLTFFSAVYLVQSFLEKNELQGKRIAVITNLLYKVTGNENCLYHQSLLQGIMNVIAQEHAVTCCSIDINLNETTGEAVTDLVNEINNIRATDRIVALRHGQRWIQDYQRNTGNIQMQTNGIKEGGVYLITGGLGNVGYVLARHLIEKHHIKLVLIGRKKMADPLGNEEWVNRLKFLQALGKEVHYYSADVANREAFINVINDVKAMVGPVQGVIHAAGNINRSFFELTEDISYENAMALLSAKVNGLENLFEVFGPRTPDFVWITSSLSTVLGGAGFSAYAAANLFMEHFITAKIKELPNWKCIGLSEILLKEDEAQKELSWKRKGITPEELVTLFEWSIGLRNVPVILQTT
jgi:acyl transferase domain-containing protein